MLPPRPGVQRRHFCYTRELKFRIAINSRLGVSAVLGASLKPMLRQCMLDMKREKVLQE